MEAAVIGAYEKDLESKGVKMNREKLSSADTLYKKEGVFVSGDIKNVKNVIFADRKTYKSELRDIKLDVNLTSKYNGNKNVIVRNIAINGKQVGALVFENSENSLFGFKINSLFSFFIIFIVMSGTTSLLLLLLHKKVEKLMNGIR
jgi:hypothetical protein